MSISSSVQPDYPVPSLLTTKGDIVTHNGTTLSRVPAGTNGYALNSNSSETNGVVWAIAPSGSTAAYVPIANSVLTANAASVSITGIPGSYKAIGIIVISKDTSSGQRDLRIRFNDATAGYSFVSRAFTGTSGNNFQSNSGTSMNIETVGANGANNVGQLHMTIQQYATTSQKYGLFLGGGAEGDTIWATAHGHFAFTGTSAISSIQFSMDFTSATARIASGSSFYVYGLK
jgi:hypothetical protein